MGILGITIAAVFVIGFSIQPAYGPLIPPKLDDRNFGGVIRHLQKQITDLREDVLLLKEFTGSEEISQLFDFDLELMSENIEKNTEYISKHSQDDVDLDSSNELQTLSITGNELSISQGNTITLPRTVCPVEKVQHWETIAWGSSIAFSHPSLPLVSGGIIKAKADPNSVFTYNELVASALNNLGYSNSGNPITSENIPFAQQQGDPQIICAES